MLPSITIRIDNVLKAMEEVIVPSIRKDAGMAQDQAALVLRHLRLIRQEWSRALVLEKQSLEGIRLLALDLCKETEGSDMAPEIAELAAAVTRSEQVKGDLPEVYNAHYCDIGECVDALIETTFQHGTAEQKERLTEAVMRYGIAQSRRERTWFKATGMDPEAAELDDFQKTFG